MTGERIVAPTRLDPELHARLMAYAERHGIDRSEAMRRLIERGLGDADDRERDRA